MTQLDIFDDSRDVMLRNDVLSALRRNDPSAARRALQRLSSEYPDHDSLAAFAILVHALEKHNALPVANHDAVAAARKDLLDRVEPAAGQWFGLRAATAWLSPLWQNIASHATPLPFLPERSECHPAPLWLHAREWGQAISATEQINSWRRIPAPLAWMTEATYRLNGIEASLAMRVEFAWLSPVRFDALAKRLADPALNALL